MKPDKSSVYPIFERPHTLSVPLRVAIALFLLAGCALISVPLFASESTHFIERDSPSTASISGKWRTSGKFSVKVSGQKVIGGEGPVWVKFKKGGGIITEMGFPIRWRKSGSRLKLVLDKKKTKSQLGKPTSIRHSRSSLSRSGRKITGNFKCTFTVSGQTVQWTWKFTGHQ